MDSVKRMVKLEMLNLKHQIGTVDRKMEKNMENLNKKMEGTNKKAEDQRKILRGLIKEKIPGTLDLHEG
jgi:hypothetical protein